MTTSERVPPCDILLPKLRLLQTLCLERDTVLKPAGDDPDAIAGPKALNQMWRAAS